MLRKIKPGGTIAVIAPAFPPVPEKTELGITYLESKGLKVKRGASLSGNWGYFSATDEQRAKEVNKAFADPDVDAIICARGGWGGLRLLDMLDYAVIKTNPKALVGYSDITFLQLAIWRQCAVPSISGPMVAVEMGGGIISFTEKHFWGQVENTAKKYVIDLNETDAEIWQQGQASGTLLGGCLSMIAHQLGTPYSPNYTGAILFFEDVGEEPYKIDRYLAQLKQAGIFEQIKGLIIGEFIDCADDKGDQSFTIEKLLQQYFDEAPFPVLYNFPYGHGMKKISMPVGMHCQLNSQNREVIFNNPFI